MTVAQKVVKFLEEKGDLSVKELVDLTDASKQAIHLSINQLLENNTVVKFGRVPKTIYRLVDKKIVDKPSFQIEDQTKVQYLTENFLMITEIGKVLLGAEAFMRWCFQRKLPFEKTIDEFIKTREKYESYYDELGIISGKTKLINTKGYDKIYLDEVFYLDFYAIERFGKTKLGTILHYAKQGQNKFLMKMLLKELRSKIDALLEREDFDAVAFVPPTIRRELQLMKYLETHLKINLPKINIQKISGIIPVPQKSLHKLEERITNAKNTFAVSENIKYNHVLLLDDAVGSGSTLNQIAEKLKRKDIAQKITGLAIVGSFKGFDVVTDV
ncbi:DeoR/GlpR family transcriptional regulator of sugar metabolism [Pedobacter sp. UYP30]|uniref:ComF family protein n=1 Tax=Pedobacter sp. UYP30 TaxID=1756400 RepID=UPI00339322C2